MKPNSNEKFVCYDCFRLKACKEPTTSWVFFFVALIAVIAIRAVNVALNFNPLLAKILWYAGVGGFFIYFIYKFRYDSILHRELERTKLVNKLLSKGELSEIATIDECLT